MLSFEDSDGYSSIKSTDPDYLTVTVDLLYTSSSFNFKIENKEHVIKSFLAFRNDVANRILILQEKHGVFISQD
jgi:hypothetical protein